MAKKLILILVLLICLSFIYPGRVFADSVEFYSMHWAPTDQWQMLSGYGLNTFVITLRPSGSQQSWESVLEAAVTNDVKLIVSLWPRPYQMNGDEADISGAMNFLNFLNSRPEYRERVIALYGTDEPYWQGCYGCGWTTTQMIDLRNEIRNVIPGMALYYDMGDLSFWEERSQDSSSPFYQRTWIDDSAYDYTAIYFRANMSQAEIQDKLEANADLIAGQNSRGRRLNIKLVSFLNTYQLIREGTFDIPMPTYEQMIQISEQVITSGLVDTWGYYPWYMAIYDDSLREHPELWPAIAEVYDSYIAEGSQVPTAIPTPTPTGLLGDIDGDGDVDQDDYNILLTNFGATACGNQADINSDCDVDIFDYNIVVENFGSIISPTPTLTPTTTPTPTLLPTTTPTPLPSPTPAPGAFDCSHVIGFSQTSQWWSGFESVVNNPQWELKWRSYGAIERWADPNSDFWNTNVMSNCSQNSSWNAERVLLTITGCPTDRPGACPPGTTEKVVAEDWVADIQSAIVNIINRYPRVRRIDLQPVVGGPGNQICYREGSEVRASRNHPVVDRAISLVVAQDTTGIVFTGYSPEVSSCSGFSDTLGHLTASGGWETGQNIGRYYGE